MKKEIVSKENYGNFIKNLNLKELKLISANTSVVDQFVPPANLKINDDSKYENLENKQIKITMRYHLEAVKPDTDKPGLIIDLTYVLLYSSEIPMTDDIFKIYKQSSLRVQTWPYFRQFVHQITLDMHLPPLVLDTIKSPV
jgi:preprotein translocase subunit SecB